MRPEPRANAPAAGTAREALRLATAAAHAAVEARLGLIDRDLTVDGYRRRLRCLHRVVAPLEQDLAGRGEALAALGLAWPQRRKLALLEADLAELGDGPPPPPLAAAALPRLAGVAEALGALYVVEGATLGGLIIARHLRATLGAAAGASRYFRSYGAGRGAMWRAYCAAAERGLPSPAARARAAQAARATFAAYLSALAGLEGPPR